MATKNYVKSWKLNAIEFMVINKEFSCFHITTEDRLPNILKYGLKPNSPRNRASNRTPHVMLSLYPIWSLYNNFKKKQGIILIEIRHPQIKREMFVNDPEGLDWEDTIEPIYFRAVVRIEIIK